MSAKARQDVITALDKIADGQREGQTAKQLAGEVLVQAKRLWRFAEAREWVETSCIEKLTRKPAGRAGINTTLRTAPEQTYAQRRIAQLAAQGRKT